MASVPTQVQDVAKALAKSLAGLARSGVVTADAEMTAARLAICRKPCEQFTGTRCRACGCFVALKASLEAQACPMGYW